MAMAKLPPRDISFIHSVLDDAGFSSPQLVSGRFSIADIYKPNQRCGIYVFRFKNGDWYAGQAVNVARRFVQHTKNHLDIEEMRFKKVSQAQLNEVEQATIHALEAAGCRMRNVIFTNDIAGERDFDQIMSPLEQETWLNSIQPALLAGTRIQDPALHARHHHKFVQWMEHPQAKDALAALKRYIQTCIPIPFQSEAVFWSLSCLPPFNNTDVTILNRVNINLQEVLTLDQMKGEKDIFFSLHLSKTPLRKAYGPAQVKLQFAFPLLAISNHKYKPGGTDQIYLECQGAETFLRLLEEPPVVAAARLFNLRLMRKGATIWSRNHCLDLADELFKGNL